MSKPPEALRLADRTCKTCKHFSKLSYGDGGFCNVTLPPWLDLKIDYNVVHKNASCDMHTATEAEGEQE
jgi:hypothetical protein